MKQLTISLSDRKLRILKQRAKLLKQSPDTVIAELIRDYIQGTMLIFVEGHEP